ncbi:MAG: hypothetical protein AAF992_26060 [Bacteroidota bacterium]
MDPQTFAYLTIRPDSSVNYGVSSTALNKGYAISDKTAITLVESINQETADLLKEIFQENKAEVEITYSSIYDEVWRTSTINFPEKIE